MELFCDVGSPYAYLAGLPPVVWPESWPADYLQAMRAATWAGDDFARAPMRAAFSRGADLSRVDVLCELYWGDDRLEAIASLV